MSQAEFLRKQLDTVTWAGEVLVPSITLKCSRVRSHFKQQGTGLYQSMYPSWVPLAREHKPEEGSLTSERSTRVTVATFSSHISHNKTQWAACLLATPRGLFSALLTQKLRLGATSRSTSAYFDPVQVWASITLRYKQLVKWTQMHLTQLHGYAMKPHEGLKLPTATGWVQRPNTTKQAQENQPRRGSSWGSGQWGAGLSHQPLGFDLQLWNLTLLQM